MGCLSPGQIYSLADVSIAIPGFRCCNRAGTVRNRRNRGQSRHDPARKVLSPVHAVAFLKAKSFPTVGPIAVLVGEERHLKRAVFERLVQEVLGGDEESLGLTRFVGEDAELKTVCDELLTVSMWGDRRLVVVDGADRFVSQFRDGLEKYLAHPAKKSVLVLDVKSWPKTTRLAKVVAKIGLEIECAPLSGAELLRWVTDSALGTRQDLGTRRRLSLA